MKMKTVYEINDREAGNKIEVCASREQAEATVRRYEEIDIAEGTYTPNFYEIVEIAAQKNKIRSKTEKMKNMTAIKEKIDRMNKLYGYERYAIPGNGWSKKSILVLNQQGVVETTISRAKFLAIR